MKKENVFQESSWRWIRIRKKEVDEEKIKSIYIEGVDEEWSCKSEKIKNEDVEKERNCGKKKQFMTEEVDERKS